MRAAHALHRVRVVLLRDHDPQAKPKRSNTRATHILIVNMIPVARPRPCAKTLLQPKALYLQIFACKTNK
ncbi:hypothetical protein A0H81_05986 [Grifola frondosa]|uniref:Uncharacterized protein n=1 Tax=Grifola frondosa TaxID=5627 RepID=A0A1C7MB07_GRIFR|nr:hypothetical protein A0H81_05986 [Grifola frondosa]